MVHDAFIGCCVCSERQWHDEKLFIEKFQEGVGAPEKLIPTNDDQLLTKDNRKASLYRYAIALLSFGKSRGCDTPLMWARP